MKPLRLQITCASGMLLVAAVAILLNHVRPMSRDEAIGSAVKLLNVQYPQGIWSTQSASAIRPMMGKMWVVSACDGSVNQRGIDGNSLGVDDAIVLIHFDGRCFRFGPDFSSMAGSTSHDVDEFNNSTISEFNFMGCNADAIFELWEQRKLRDQSCFQEEK